MTHDELEALLDKLAAAAEGGLVAPSAQQNIRQWLVDPRYREFAPQVAEHICSKQWDTLNDVFWTVIPFGTAGRRGRMYPIGSNAINRQTIGESAQGLANYVKSLTQSSGEPRCAVAYDTRHRSREFAELCCEVMAAAGFQVYFFGEHRSTPELAFAVRYFQCACGIMISASHNPPADNAIKVFWSTGGQLRPPHDSGVMTQVAAVESIERMPLGEAQGLGRVVDARDEIDMLFRKAVLACGLSGPRDLRVLYSPLHGVGATSVLPVLSADGFAEVALFAAHAEPHGDFPNVPGQIANPENPAVFGALIERAQLMDADLVLASDPDADRIGCAAPIQLGGAWRVFTGNQIAVLLASFVLSRRRASGVLQPDDYIVKTLVTTPMLERIADHYGVRTCGNVLTGFKWIGGVIDDEGPEQFAFAAEEAHGYLVGDYVRDKDAAGAAMLLAELAAQTKHEGKTLHQHLDKLYSLVGYHAEITISRTFPGAAGMAAMQHAMTRLRTEPPASLGGLRVARQRDYLIDTALRPRSRGQIVDGKECDLLFFDLETPGNSVAIRPSGTEPKLKFYLFGFEALDGEGMSERVRTEVSNRLAAVQADLLKSAGVAP